MDLHRWWLAVLLSLLCSLPRPAPACGPELVQPRLSWVDDDLLDVPKSTLRADVLALATAVEPLPGVVPRRVRTCEGVRLDLVEALGDAPGANEIVERWVQLRCGGDPGGWAALQGSVPTEFWLYAQGVAELHQGRRHEAQASFERLLALPAAQRHYRSTWAAHMLARLAEEGLSERDPVQLWAEVRELAAGGYADTLGLALAGLRLEVRHHRASGRPDRAISSLMAYLSGGGTVHDPGSVAQDVRALLASDPDTLRRAAHSAQVAGVVAAWLTSRDAAREIPDGWIEGWLDAAEATGQHTGADRLAWAAYRQGRYTDAGAWAALADPDAPMGHWVQAKLALRDGDLEHAAASLQRVVDRLDPDAIAFSRPDATCSHGSSGSRAAAIELGVVLVALDRYDDALTTFLSARDWPDAAWIAERLLTSDELMGYVDRWFPGYTLIYLPPGNTPNVEWIELRAALRHLLARRLAREGRWSEAIPYFPNGLDALARELEDALARGRDLERPDTERGEALWQAAQLARRQGWELLATEMEPDFRIESGFFELRSTTAARSGAHPTPGEPTADGSTADGSTHGEASSALSPTPTELGRLARHDPGEPRYQYLYTAWGLAKEAVELLPDDSDELAIAACTAGNWLENHDLERSSWMWLVLLRRAYATDIGRSTARAQGRWWGLDEGLCAPIPPERLERSRPSGCGQSPSSLAWALPLPLVLWRRRRRRR
ncbi:MAG TPA: hypothetical protein ENK18_08830 [Deltaproteobacteria bacterium]|nr:hypothetical protein [Deltaproteobacteria bacterium]